ncbi:hypothetical protein LguiA_019467 [Lonicera macranthoides]
MVQKISSLVLFIIVFISPPFSFSSLQEAPLYESTHDQLANGYLNSSIPEPNSIGNINNGQRYENFALMDQNVRIKYEGGNLDFGKSGQKGVRKTSHHLVNVDHFGAKGGGTDNSEAFKKAWEEACSSENSIFIVPRRRVYHLKPITFSGPCKSNLKMKIHGKIKASPHRSDYKSNPRNWIIFENIEDFVVEGGGIINGNGKTWWQHSCKINKTQPCTHAPTAVLFYGCTKLRVRNIWIKNAQQMHLSFEKCINVKASNLKVIAPEKSPNTDGIHITATQNIKIHASVVSTGDDCISIVSGAKEVEVKDLICGPGHGISIGSLGQNHSEDHVSDILVDGAQFIGTTNGVRIKTWQGGYGYAKNIKFQNIAMHNVYNPLIIDQNYCDKKGACPEQYSAVQIANVVYKNIQGTSASRKAINIVCSNTFPCEGIVLQNIKLHRQGLIGDVEASCENILHLQTSGGVHPHC